MASTEQRSGFRLPWAPEGRPVSDNDALASPADPHASSDSAPTTDDPQMNEAPEMTETATIPDRATLKWPDRDAKTATEPSDPELEIAEAALEGIAAAETDPAPTRRRARSTNPLVTGLVRAMRDASAVARQETVDRFAAEAKARIEVIHAQSADDAAELRKKADAEIVEIRDWAKAEAARIREVTDQRIADRRGRLETQVEEHTARVEHRIERVQAAISEFERQMDAFFERLLAEEDPTRLAGLAESLPEPPSLDIDDLDRGAPVKKVMTLDAGGAAAAEAEALADLGNTEVDSADADSAGAAAPVAVSEPEDPAEEADVVRRLETFAGEHAGLPEAVSSKVAVVGLVSVASIAGFKRALARTHGVRSVTVASGPSGDFIFSVAHDASTDVRAAVVALDGFGAAITGDVDGVLAVTASDPDNAR